MSVAFLPGADFDPQTFSAASADPADNLGVVEKMNRFGDLAGVGDAASLAADAYRLSDSQMAMARANEEAYRRISARVKSATGVDLGDPTAINTPDIVARINRGDFTGFTDPRLRELVAERADVLLAKAAELRAQHPDTLGDLDLETPMFQQGRAVAADARRQLSAMWAREDMGGAAKGLGWLAGSVAAGASDPANVLTVVAPAGGVGGTFVRRLASSALAGAAGGAAGAALAQGDVQGWRKAQGLDYGYGEAAVETLTGAVGGAVVGGVLHGLGEGLTRLLAGKGSPADLAAAIRATGREPTPDELAALPQAQAADEAQAALAKALAAIPEDRRAALARDAATAASDPTARQPMRELAAPPEWTDSAAVKATAGAKSFDEAVDALRRSNTTLAAIASADPDLRAAGHVAALGEAALAETRARGLPPDHAALIARHAKDEALQAELAGVLADARAQTVAEARMVLSDHVAARMAGDSAAQRLGRPLEPTHETLQAHHVVDADGRRLLVAPRLVEAATLVASDSAAYPRALQPRDRGRAASGQQIREMALRLDPERLGRSAEADRGAPIVGPDMIVESGNGRVAAIREAFRAGGEAADAYRAWLTKQGLDVEGMAEPVLVRVRASALTDAERMGFTLAANKAATLDLSAAERALADARLLDAELLAGLASPDMTAPGNADFARAFVARLPQAEQGRLADAAGRLSPEGADRIRKALVARAYGDSPVLSRIADSIEDEVRGLSVALTHAAPDWARLRAEIDAGRVRPELDATAELVRAVDEAASLRASGQTLAERLAQLDAFDPRDGIVDAFLRLFYDAEGKRPAAAKTVAEALRFYATEARQVSGAADAIGLAPAVDVADILSATLRRQGLDPTVSPVRARRPAIDAGADAGARGGGAGPPGPDGAGAPARAEAGGAAPAGGGADAGGGAIAGERPGGGADAGPVGAAQERAGGAAGGVEAGGGAASGGESLGAAPPPLQAGLDAVEVKAAWRREARFATLEDMLAAAPANQARVAAAGESIARELGVEFKNPGVKRDVARMRQKMEAGSGAPGHLTDVVRGGFIADDPAVADAIVARLTKQFEMIDEGWQTTPQGYFDRKLYVRFEDGMIGELQIWPRELLDAKNATGHALYEDWRRLPPGDPGRLALGTQMRELYSAALATMPPSWNAVSGRSGSAPNLASNAARSDTAPAKNISAGSIGDQRSPPNTQASADVYNAGSPSQRANEGSVMSGVSESDVGASAPAVKSRNLDLRPVDVDGETRFLAADVAGGIDPPEVHVANLVKGCKA